MKKVRFGIIGTGMIGKLFAQESKLTDNCTVIAVTSRSEETGKAFAEVYGIEKVYTDYEVMINDPDIDAIYIATPHTNHHADTIRALNAKKAVLCEKPFAMSYEETVEMIDAARKNNVLLMEAMWTRFLPAVKKMKQLLTEGAIGDVLFVKADFGFRVGDDYPALGRLLNPELGGGALYDAGVYPISMASHVMGMVPVAISCQKMFAKTGVDAMSTYNFQYENGSLAVLYSAVNVNTENQLYISGTKGSITIPDFLRASKMKIAYEDGKMETYVYPHKDAGYDNEIKAFCDTYLNGNVENETMPLDETLSIMKTMDTIKHQLNTIKQ